MLSTENTQTHNQIRKYVAAFGSLFNNIIVKRYDGNGVITQKIHVPISFADKTNWWRKLREDSLVKDVPITNISLPRMYFDLISMEYAKDMQRQKTNRHQLKLREQGSEFAIKERVPWDFTFELGVASDNLADATQILEMILPYFSPEFVIGVNDLKDLDIKSDIPVELVGNPTREHQIESSFEKLRIVSFKMSFKLRGYLYQPTVSQGLITKSYVQFLDKDFGTTFIQAVSTATTAALDCPIDTQLHKNPEKETPGILRNPPFGDIHVATPQP